MKLDRLLSEPGVVAAWRWSRRPGEKPAVRATAGAITKDLAGNGSLYLEMLVRVADSQCMLLDARGEFGNFFPSKGIVVGGNRLVVLGTPNGVAVSVDPEARPDLWKLRGLMQSVGEEE